MSTPDISKTTYVDIVQTVEEHIEADAFEVFESADDFFESIPEQSTED